MADDTITITDIFTDSKGDQIPAILAKFTNGQLYDDSNLELTYKSDKVGKRKRGRLTGQCGNVTYTGIEDDVTSNDDGSQPRYYLGVVNKESKTMQIYDMKTFTIHPEVQVVKEENDQSRKKRKNRSLLEKNDELVKAFGSKKKRNAVKTREASKVEQKELDSIAKDALDHRSQTPKSPKAKLQEQDTLLPPCNINATDVKNVYNIKDSIFFMFHYFHLIFICIVISPKEMEVLKTPAVIFMHATKEKLEEWRDEPTKSKYFLEHLQILPLEDNLKLEKICYLLYISYLIQFHHLKAKDFRGKNEILVGIPDKIQISLLDNFSVKLNDDPQNKRYYHLGRCVTKFAKDKLLARIIVLALFIDDFRLNCNVLARDLKITEKRFTDVAKVVGCHVDAGPRLKKEKGLQDDDSIASGGKLVTLKLPLNVKFMSGNDKVVKR
ncbi:DNA-directed RNA polymerase I subunit RPA49 [Trichoplax sp. H2]|nr:DNA-directed RNA polymerase I subunit RPA49 [Trichoplax sp. H2]|eukprot:RDD39201.1 DNA-directed RNA polymerase I subunit RPA49 [Trichoplax sp. H2]